jgi:hypothetical protein
MLDLYLLLLRELLSNILFRASLCKFICTTVNQNCFLKAFIGNILTPTA